MSNKSAPLWPQKITTAQRLHTFVTFSSQYLKELNLFQDTSSSVTALLLRLLQEIMHCYIEYIIQFKIDELFHVIRKCYRNGLFYKM